MRSALALFLLLTGAALAHKPHFPEASPVQVTAPTVSQAFYISVGTGETFVFELPPLPRAVPVQVLVLDDEAGRALEPYARLTCGGEARLLATLDAPFFEGFSRLHHRYRVADSAGPTENACWLGVGNARGAPGLLVVALGDEERFDLADVLGLLTLQERLRAWQAR